MNIKRKCQVVMIPTNKKHFNKGEIILNPFINDLYIASMGCICYDNEIPQHLYITSNEEIKEGEYGLSALNEVVVIGKLYKNHYIKKLLQLLILHLSRFSQIRNRAEQENLRHAQNSQTPYRLVALPLGLTNVD